MAQRLGFHFLNTGAMYRAVALAGMREGVDWDRPEELVAVARRVEIRPDGERTLLDGEDVTEAVRTKEVTAHTKYAADNPEIRTLMVELQRAAAAGRDIVTEGRDQGTVVFPGAQRKFFLTASEETRAQRRVLDHHRAGETASLEEIIAQQRRRDEEDSQREVGPLVPAEDAIKVPTDDLTEEQVVELLCELVAKADR